MKILKIVLLIILVLLSLAAGVAKVMLAPEEKAFLSAFGLSEFQIILFGSLQIAGGLLASIPKSRLVGLFAMLVGFLLSVIMIISAEQSFVDDRLVFTIIAILPVIATVWMVFVEWQYRNVPSRPTTHSNS